MRLHPNAAYWSAGGINAVPHMTGAGTLLDCHDVVETCAKLGLTLPLESVLDVGCGTGRLAQLCREYRGCDISTSGVEYCLQRGLNVVQIAEAGDLARYAMLERDGGINYRPWIITAFSVFTHMDRAERCSYLAWFREIAPRVLIDVIPGNGAGDVARWTASVPGFISDLAAFGYHVRSEAEREAPDAQSVHHYVFATTEDVR